MEKNSSSSSSSSSSKKGGSSSSSNASSYMTELFGPNPSSHSSSGSSSSIFGTVFGPPSTGGRRDGQASNIKHGAPGYGGKGENSKNSYYQQETIEQPCNYSNSIYYGGQEVYSPTTRNTDSHHTFKKDDQQDDDPNSASRGNWITLLLAKPLSMCEHPSWKLSYADGSVSYADGDPCDECSVFAVDRLRVDEMNYV
ncbi:hypothetical protein KSS87_001180 [Heliosperma pusillum]|nr:hypothetical protein KSS87_001180 [Heliosperma pusillum]